jgi:predicted TPR repeat methyltransferase
MADDPKTLSAVELHSRDAVEFDSRYRAERGFAERHLVWNDLIRRHGSRSARALDLGCGSGELLVPMTELVAHVTGLDGSQQMLDLCRKKLQPGMPATLVCGDVADAPRLAPGPYDLVVASSVVEYLDDLDRTLAMVRDLLRPGGCFILSLPNASSVYRRLEPVLYALSKRPNYFPYIRNRATVHGLDRRLTDHGFEVTEHRFLGRTFGLSAMLRPLGLARWSDNLLVMACRRPR